MPTDLSARLDRLLEIGDFKQFQNFAMRELRRQWRARHPKKRPGPTRLDPMAVYQAVDAVLEKIRPREWLSLGWEELITQVQLRVRPHQTGRKLQGDLYSAATIRQHVRQYFLASFYAHEIPPCLLDGRQPWVPKAAKTPDARGEAFYRHKAKILPKGLREDILKRLIPKGALLKNSPPA